MMRVVVVSESAERAEPFAVGLQREFASHGVTSQTQACDVRDFLGSGALDMAEASVVVLLPEAASLAGEAKDAAQGGVLVVGEADARRRNVRKIANDVLSLARE